MQQLHRISFLIHGFCYAELNAAQALPANLVPYLARETRCAEAWRAAVAAMSATEGLAIVPWPGASRGPVREFNAFASRALGDRCFVFSNSPGRLVEQMAMPYPSRGAAEMQQDPEFQKVVYALRTRIETLGEGRE